jgi:hypothetical protein
MRPNSRTDFAGGCGHELTQSVGSDGAAGKRVESGFLVALRFKQPPVGSGREILGRGGFKMSIPLILKAPCRRGYTHQQSGQ